MLKCPLYQSSIGRATTSPGLVYRSRRILTRVDVLAAALAALDPAPHLLHAGEGLPLVVERGHDHMPPLMPRRIVPVMEDDEAADVVVFRVNSRHR